ncbi:hypothetical protein Bhz59_00054 [Stenotrophomonas phage vB_SmaS_Bhz59]
MNSAKPSRRSLAAPSLDASTPRRSPAPSSLNTPSGLNSRSTGFAASPGRTDHSQFLLGMALIAVMFLGLILAVVALTRSILDKPDVYTSDLTRECVKVVNSDGSEGSCDNLPETYNNIWVE